MRCRHCRRRKALAEHNGLCGACHGDKAVRERYPYADATRHPEQSWGKDKNVQGALPDEPTTAKPGTTEKMDVMAQRAHDYRRLDHPKDAKLDEDERLIKELLEGQDEGD